MKNFWVIMKNIKVRSMSEIKRMRHLLEEMVEAADEGDKVE